MVKPDILHFQSWDTFFRNVTAGAQPGEAYTSPPTLAEPTPHHVPLSSLAPALTSSGAAPTYASDAPISDKVIDDHLAVQGIIRAYQVRHTHLVTICFVYFQQMPAQNTLNRKHLFPPLQCHTAHHTFLERSGRLW